jgi:ATP-binding cassette, subfamily B, bacterial
MDVDSCFMGVAGRMRQPYERVRATLHSRLELVRTLAAASPWLVAATTAAALVAGLLPVGLMLAGGVLASRIGQAVRHGAGDAQLHAAYRAFAVVMGLFLAGELMVPLQSRLRWLITKRIDGVMRLRVMRAALAGTDMTRLHGEDYLDAMRLAHGLIRWSATPGGGAAGLMGLTRDYLTGIAAAAVLATFQPGIAALALVAALVVRVRWRSETIGLIDIWIEGWRSRRESSYFTELGLGRTGAGEVRLFGLRDWLRGRIRAAGTEAWTPTWRRRAERFGTTTALQVVLSGAVAVGALVWAARASANGDLGIGGLVVFVPALVTVLALGRTFSDDMPVQYGTVTLPAIETLERLAAETVSRETGRRIPEAGTAPQIELRGVSFRYPGGTDDVLRDVDLRIPAGGSAALVGLNGAGKTTLVRLLCGLYPPDRGAVLVDGVDLREIDLGAWHRLVAPMFQEFVRLPATVAENVAAGAIEHVGERAGTGVALDEAGAALFAGRLPDGADTLLATRHADGSDLSGGQWQRLGIARALFALQHGARLLVLDEPTSNLDTATEERIVRRLLDGTRGDATTLLVTHRLALARRTDHVVVIADGRVAEAGTHDELMRAGGRYADAFSMQAALYPLEEPGGG